MRPFSISSERIAGSPQPVATTAHRRKAESELQKPRVRRCGESESPLEHDAHLGLAHYYDRVPVGLQDPRYPTRPYEVIGVVSAKRYKPGFTDPTVSDAIPQLRAAGQQLGAHAVVVRNARSLNDRHTVVEAEAIRFTDIPAGSAAPAASNTECKSCAKIGGGGD